MRRPVRFRPNGYPIVCTGIAATLAIGCAQSKGDNPGGAVTVGAAALVASPTLSSPGCGLASAPLAVSVLTNSCGANQAQQFFQVTNTGTSPIKLSDINVKFWVDDTSGQSVVPHVWTGGCVTGVNGNPSCVHQVSNVTANATAISSSCGPDANHQANWEITVSDTDATTLPAGATWSNIQAALNLANFSNFTPGSSHWFSPCMTGSQYVSDPHFAVYFQGNLVFSSAITAPVCRAPQGTQTLSGYVTPAVAAAPIVGPVPPATILNLSVGVPVTDPSALSAQVQAVSDPTSASFRQYMTIDQFAAAFAASATDYQSVVNWATANGFSVTTYPNRIQVDVTATAAQIEQALFANLVFRQRPDGSQFFSLERDPSLCGTTTVPIRFVSGLDNLVIPMPHGGTGPNNTNSSTDVRAAYASCTKNTGTTQLLGLFELDGYTGADITGFECRSNLATCNPAQTTITAGTVPTVTNVLVNGFSGTPSTNTNQTLEVTSDIELAIAMAPGLQQVVVFEAKNGGGQGNTNGILNKMALRPDVHQFSSSWTGFGDQNTQPIIQEMALQGQSFFQISQDAGSSSWSGDPGDIRDEEGLTVVGATVLTLTGPPQTYSSETTWNQKNLGASGGGFANKTPIPGYQVPFNLAAAGQPEFRQLPDISMVGANLYVFFNGSNSNFFGTSAAAPLWAGYAALANDVAVQTGELPVGFANPFLYFIANKSAGAYQTNFNDINDGSNNAGTGTPFSNWTPQTGNFIAGNGYDLATGLGSPKCALLNALGSGVVSSGTGAGGAGGTGGAGGAGGIGGQPPVTITYHQVGACNGFVNNIGDLVSVGPNAAYVLFGITSIDNSEGTTPFAFDPTKLFVKQGTLDFVDPGLQLYSNILGPFAAIATTVNAGQDLQFQVSAQNALVVSTANSDGSVEANMTSYVLNYNTGASDPPVTLVKSNTGQTFPNTEDCSTILLQ